MVRSGQLWYDGGEARILNALYEAFRVVCAMPDERRGDGKMESVSETTSYPTLYTFPFILLSYPYSP